MESLGDELWDVIIAGTSLPQSLLALSLSKCDLKILHVDQNDYYGGIDAGLSLDETQKWIDCQISSEAPENSSHFKIRKADDPSALGPSRAYTISLKPQLIFAKSRFLPTLVSSQIHTQLEFQAVGSFFVYTDGKLQKIPSNREDVFADDTLSVRDKRRLMGLLRYVIDEHDESVDTSGLSSIMQIRLQDQFKLPESLMTPVQALSLVTNSISIHSFDNAMDRLKRHLMSTGYFGPGLAAVMSKYGGNSEIAQVACRAGAVGGAVYLLGHGISSADRPKEGEPSFDVTLSDGTKVRTKHLVGTTNDIPSEISSDLNTSHSETRTTKVSYSVSIASQPLRHLFAATADGGPVPAVAVVLVPSEISNLPPIYLQVHSEDTGECPSGQCIIYASTLDQTPLNQDRLTKATTNLLQTAENKDEPATVLWNMTFSLDVVTSSTPHNLHLPNDPDHKVIVFPERTHDLAFDDTVLDNVKSAWETILGERSAEYDFLRFEERRDADDED